MTLWTPGGEHPVDPPPAETAPESAPETAPELTPELTPEEAAQLSAMQTEMDEVRQQLLAAPASVVIANHAMGIYELAAIHLTAEHPGLPEAVLAIDALSALLEGLEGRLGEPEATLREALTHLKAGYLEVRNRTDGAAEPR